MMREKELGMTKKRAVVRKRRKLKRPTLIVVLLLVVGLTVGCVYGVSAFTSKESVAEVKQAQTQMAAPAVENKENARTSEKQEAKKHETRTENGLFYVDNTIIVNKKHGLPSTYNPGENKEASKSFNTMLDDMTKDGLSISRTYSGFRSYSTQTQLYESYVAQDGKAKADTYSARPGFSEHQTGLAFDVLDAQGDLVRDQSTAEWIVQNCARYGFVLRYMKGKEAITGYQYEPWHVRYVGEQAPDIAKSGLTLEEYFGVDGGDYIS